MASEPLHKHTLNLFEGDYERIQALYPDIGAATIIRQVVRSYLDNVEKKTRKTDLSGVEVNI